MKRICKRAVMIDALTVCCEAYDNLLFDKIAKLEFGEYIDFGEFILTRTDGRYYKNVYSIAYDDQGVLRVWGALKFGLNSGKTESNVHLSGNPKVWISLDNEALYNQTLTFLGYICEMLHLDVHNFTSLDLCLDTPFDISRFVYKSYRDSGVKTFLNGREITDRDEDRPEISRILSGSLNKDKYQTIYLKQRNAIRDKSRGVTIKTYDKAAEIRNASDKAYIMQYYGNPIKLFRTEVHLNNTEIKDYLNNQGLELNPYMLNQDILEDMFFYHLNSVIYFKKDSAHIKWEQILGKCS